MIRIHRLSRTYLLGLITIVLSCVALGGCHSLPESSFELASDSRLPRWFTLSPGLSRANVSVTMRYYVDSKGRSAIFVLHDKNNHIVEKKTVALRGSGPVTINAPSQKDSTGYPLFEVVTDHNVTEIIEHKAMEPIFYVTDDPLILKALMDVQSSPGR